jgi:hypothetical protein
LAGGLVSASVEAIEVMTQMLQGEDDRLRLRAAEQLISLSLRSHRDHAVEEELRRRVEALEGSEPAPAEDPLVSGGDPG